MSDLNSMLDESVSNLKEGRASAPIDLTPFQVPAVECPFKAGQQVQDIFSGRVAEVTEVTENGFKWRLAEPVFMGARLGSFQEGECYPTGYNHFRQFDPSAPPEPLAKIEWEPLGDYPL